MAESIGVTRINHAVLFVRDVDRAVDFYSKVFGLKVVQQERGAAFLRSETSGNHHDLGLFGVGDDARGPVRGQVGLYHLAWEVPTIEALAHARVALAEAGALTGQSDHGASKSLYGKDPDGNEFEIMWAVPREHWGEYDKKAVVQPLSIEREVARFGAS